MATKVIMPQMGESIAEGTVTKWLKKVGDRVERDEPLFEISTDKVDAEIPSPAAGVLTQILVHENETVEVNTVVAELDGEGADVQAEAPAAEAPTAAPAPVAAAAPPSRLPAQPEAAGPTGEGRAAPSSPLVYNLAREHNIDLRNVRGTGLSGRVSKKDILAYIAQMEGGGAAEPSTTPTPTPTPAPTPAPDAAAVAAPGPVASAPQSVVFAGPTRVVPMTPMRKQIAEHMTLSRLTAAHVSTVFEVEMTKVSETRARFAAEFEQRHGVKLTYTAFFVRATVEAIKEFPILNSSVKDATVVYHRDVNIGIAVALETGLIVPVIKRADEMNFLGVARAIQDLADRARTKRLNVDDVQGGTFTITNPGIFGSLFGTPIINQPQVAILGVGTIEKRAVVRHDAIAIRPMVYLALSFDHRVIDGAVADQFMGRIKLGLEEWEEPVL
ncbi:MAG: dihydrolipoamide acetyltransferase family protein [Terriglobia bacterium]